MPTAPASPWQNGFAERLIRSIRRECLDYIVVFGEAHLRRILRSYTRYYNRASEHIRFAGFSPGTADRKHQIVFYPRVASASSELFETRQTGKFGFEVVAIGRASVQRPTSSNPSIALRGEQRREP
jgi:Integrase core domain